jgi:hypothetical protein
VCMLLQIICIIDLCFIFMQSTLGSNTIQVLLSLPYTMFQSSTCVTICASNIYSFLLQRAPWSTWRPTTTLSRKQCCEEPLVCLLQTYEGLLGMEWNCWVPGCVHSSWSRTTGLLSRMATPNYSSL